MTPTTIPSVFPVPSSITKSEPTPEARGPAIFCLTSSRTVSGTRNFFACREALAGCRGEALTRWGMSERACAVRHSHILSRFLRVCVTGTLAQCRQFFAPRRPPRKRAVLATGQQIILPFSCHSCSARSTNWQSGNLTKCALIQTTLRFVCRAVCDAQKTEKRREFSGRMWECRTAHARSDIPHLVRASPRHPASLIQFYLSSVSDGTF